MRTARQLIVSLLLLATAGMACAQAFGGLKGHNSNQPVDFSADRIELQDRQDRAVLSGHVDVQQGDMSLRAERLTIAYARGDRTQVNRMDASGGVLLQSGRETARGQFAVYDLQKRIITIVGGVSLERPGQAAVRGARLTITLDNGSATLDGSAVAGGSGGRVTGRFTPPPRAN